CPALLSSPRALARAARQAPRQRPHPLSVLLLRFAEGAAPGILHDRRDRPAQGAARAVLDAPVRAQRRVPLSEALGSPASRQRREDRDDVARGERTSGLRVLTVHEHDAREVRGDPQPTRDVVDGRSFRNVERDSALGVRSGQIREEGREEPDFDLQRRSSATRSRSPGRIWSRLSRLFQRSTSSTDSPYRLAIELTVSSGLTTWISRAAAARRGAVALAAGRRGTSAVSTPSRVPAGMRTSHLVPGGVIPRTSVGFSARSIWSERPRAELAGQIAQVRCGGDGGLFGIEPLVHPPVHAQTVAARCGGHELPEPLRADAGNGARVEAALDHRREREVRRETLIAEHL